MPGGLPGNSARTMALALLSLFVMMPHTRAMPVGGQPDVKHLFRKQLEKPGDKVNLGLAYWIELHRQGRVYRCNNKFAFRSGDAIRIHVIPNSDGYAYIFLKSGSRGDRAVLFPNPKSGTDNRVLGGHDYALPTAARLKFDDDAGTEILTLVLSRKPIDMNRHHGGGVTRTAYVSSGQSGAKDLVPTRMQLCWDDPAPVIIPGEIAAEPEAPDGGQPGASASEPKCLPADLNQAGMVTVIHDDPDEVLSVDIALEHRM